MLSISTNGVECLLGNQPQAPGLLKEQKRNKLLAKSDETCSTSGVLQRLYVCLVNKSNILESERRAYKTPNESRCLSDDPRVSQKEIAYLSVTLVDEKKVVFIIVLPFFSELQENLIRSHAAGTFAFIFFFSAFK